MKKYYNIAVLVTFVLLTTCEAQKEFMLPLSDKTLIQIMRVKTPVPPGRKAVLSDVRLLYYGNRETEDPLVYRLSNISDLPTQNSFDNTKPTVFYAHGYVELMEDESVTTVVEAYVKTNRSNFIVIDWSNLAFGSYILSSRNVEKVGRGVGAALRRLWPARVHLVGHSLGAHLVAVAARALKGRGGTVDRLTGLDPAFPGFYPPLQIFGNPISSEDATFVDIIHTDGGRYGSLSSNGHADFWPNEGSARQPGCPINSIPFTYEDFCSHWRSWRLWAESVRGGRFVARRCDNYDAFLRGRCGEGLDSSALMGIDADIKLRGNYYLRTAPSKPFALGDRGAD